MGGISSFLDIIFFAVIAVILILRLRAVLGRRTGHERPPGELPTFRRRPAPDEGAATNGKDNGKIIPLPGARNGGRATPQTAAPKPLDFPGGEGLRKADPSFDPDEFLHGAKIAFDMIVTGFAAGDEAKIRPLMNDPVFSRFKAAIDDRKSRQETQLASVIGIKEAKIVAAAVEGRDMLVTVRFVSEQINCTKNKEGHVIEGHPSDLIVVTDEWRFARPLKSRDPNWQLVGTFTPDDA